ncbi:unnamed protein product [Periconia digitata]|uniref:Atg28p n=1 Tax=Periconia digitata TaxID=1303443 RepID=A0A9W4XPK0_9PLEO|nr:unnamed protein product [Periconia digitata]
MSLFNSVLGSISPRLRDSFEDPHARDHELLSYHSSSVPRVPPPVASTILWNAPQTRLSPPPQVPDHLLAIQRKARHLEQQLQELLDSQADGLISGLAGNEAIPDDLVSNGSTTPTVSSMRGGTDRGSESGEFLQPAKKTHVGLNTARKRIARRIQQLASVKAEELDVLEDNLRDLDSIVKKTSSWTEKRTRLTNKIDSLATDTTVSKTQSLQTQAFELEQEIRQKEEELLILKTRHRRVLNELADTENSLEARSSSYKASLSYLDKEINTFLARSPNTNHVPLSTSPFLTLPPSRRTLEMAHDYWQEEQTRLSERCEEVDIDRAALDEGAVLWTEVVQRIMDFEVALQNQMTRPYTVKGTPSSASSDSTKLIERMSATVLYLEDTLELASQRGWNLLVCAIGAELEAFKQGQSLLEQTLGVSKTRPTSNGKTKQREVERLVDGSSSSSTPLSETTDEEDHRHEDLKLFNDGEGEEEISRSTIRIGPPTSISQSPPPSVTLTMRSPKLSSSSPPKKQQKQSLFDTDDDENDDPDPELLISHE